ncbi:3-methyladenine DNA glycosylase [Gephyromycinifex aptenodytis]|uniref:3-methyladenine DNA glycosylase n=1 Tax=Gephyromycinifex aptenodytis TaxID=2716227 RepID=UPI001D025E9A|nr:3-methyladenine DNA glycosylase [Gephyromycinifex aptenodytis]
MDRAFEHVQTWEEPRWRAAESAHEQVVDEMTAKHQERRRAGESHPVEDFLFVYYRLRPGKLRRWHPGPGVALAGADPNGRGQWPYYRYDAHGSSYLDVPAYVTKRGDAVRFIHDLLAATAARPPQLSCFGLHEWAMVYRLEPGRRRHESWPLRLTEAETDAVVESLPLRCTHADAFRFYTPAARPLNSRAPVRETQIQDEQPGCVHATMDLYKWATKLGPAVPGELLLDTFALARRARTLDMRAAPYDLSALGYEPICIETAAGRAEYAAAQRRLAEQGAALRQQLLELSTQLLTWAQPQAATAGPGETPALS